MQIKGSRDKKVRATLDMMPMIDVTFQLIIFFLLSSTFVVQTSVPIELSRSEGAAQLEKKNMTITLAAGEGGPDNGGAVYADDTEITAWIDLRRVLLELKNRNPDALVLVRPDRNVPTERLVYVLGMANNLGIVHYGIAAQQAEPPEDHTGREDARPAPIHAPPGREADLARVGPRSVERSRRSHGGVLWVRLGPARHGEPP